MSIQHRETAFDRFNVASPQVTEVRLAIQRGYSLSDEDAPYSEILHNALLGYGTRLTETTVSLGYALVWDPERRIWIWVCSSVTTFEVSFGGLGTVVVEARDGVIML